MLFLDKIIRKFSVKLQRAKDKEIAEYAFKNILAELENDKTTAEITKQHIKYKYGISL